MTEPRDLITIRYDVWEGDVTRQFLLPVPQTGISDVLEARIISSGQWEVTSTEPDAHASWIGQGRGKHEAILNYLKARLGMTEERTEGADPL